MPKRCAVIGAGRVAQECHFPVLRALGVRLQAVCDIDCSAAAGAAQKFGIPQTYSDYGELLRGSRGVDFVVVTTPGFTHHQIIQAALDEGLDIVTEKPVALSLIEAQRIQQRASALRRKVFVAQTWRFRGPTQLAAQAIAEGRLGHLRHVSVVHRSGDLFAPTEPAWCHDEITHRVLLFEYGIHLLDIATWLAGPVVAIGNVNISRNLEKAYTEHITATVKHASGVLQTIDLQLSSPSPMTYLELHGDAAVARLSFFPHYYREDHRASTPIDDLCHDAGRLASFAREIAVGALHRSVPRRALPHLDFYRSVCNALQGRPQRTPIDLASVMPTMSLLDQLAARVYPMGQAAPANELEYASDKTNC